MSELNPRVTASANPVVAKRHGLTKWDRNRGQYVAPEPEDTTNDLEEAEESAPGYDTLTVADLKAELDKRKAEYEKAEDTEGVEAVTYSKSDKKEDLIVLLQEDDAAIAEPSEED